MRFRFPKILFLVCLIAAATASAGARTFPLGLCLRSLNLQCDEVSTTPR